MPTTHTSRRRHRSKGSDPIQSDPCSNVFIYELGRMIEYFDNSCTSTVEGIHFPSDSTTVLGDMDTVDLEQMEMDTIADTATITDTIGETVDTSYSASDIRPNYSYATDDGSTVFSASSRASYTTQNSFRNKPSKSPTKGPVAKFRMVGRMHAKVPETNTSPMKKIGTFEDSSIVTAPTDSSTSSKENDIALVENLQNTTIEEEKDEVTSEVASEEGKTEALPPPQRTQSNESATKAPQVVTPSPEQPKKPVTEKEQKMDAAIMQGLDLCRRIRRSYQHPKSSPIQYQSSPGRTSSNELAQIPESSPDNGAPAAYAPKTKMYADRASTPSNTTETPNKPPAETAPSTTSAPKTKSGTRMSQKLKGIVPFGGRKASF